MDKFDVVDDVFNLLKNQIKKDEDPNQKVIEYKNPD